MELTRDHEETMTAHTPKPVLIDVVNWPRVVFAEASEEMVEDPEGFSSILEAEGELCEPGILEAAFRRVFDALGAAPGEAEVIVVADAVRDERPARGVRAGAPRVAPRARRVPGERGPLRPARDVEWREPAGRRRLGGGPMDGGDLLRRLRRPREIAARRRRVGGRGRARRRRHDRDGARDRDGVLRAHRGRVRRRDGGGRRGAGGRAGLLPGPRQVGARARDACWRVLAVLLLRAERRLPAPRGLRPPRRRGRPRLLLSGPLPRVPGRRPGRRRCGGASRSRSRGASPCPRACLRARRVGKNKKRRAPARRPGRSRRP